MHSRASVLLLPLLGICGLLSGCGTYKHTAPYPANAPQAEAKVTDTQPSKMSSFPPGIYYNKDSRMVFNGHQKGEMVGSMFGLIGVIVADQINKNNGKDRFDPEGEISSFDLVGETRSIFEEELAAHPSSKLLLNPEVKPKVTLCISPYILMDYDGYSTIHPFLAMEVRLSTKQQTLWDVRYFAQAPMNFSEETWKTDAQLPDAIKTAIRRACTALIMEINGELTGTRKVQTSCNLAWLTGPRTTLSSFKAVVVGETDDCYILRLVFPDMSVLSGVQIIEKDSISLTDAEFKLPWKEEKAK